MPDLGKLESDIAALRAEVRRLSDIVAITQLIAQYGPNVDSESADATAHLWTEDGVFSVQGGERSFAMNGHADIAAMVSAPGHLAMLGNGAAHVLTTPHVVVNGDNATGRSHALNIRWDASADRFWVARVSANHWKLVRTSDGWRIAERINSNLDGTEASRALLAPASA